MSNPPRAIDVWMQHPTKRFIEHPMFDSLRRWMGATQLEQELPIEFTLAAMDAGGVAKGLICAWCGPCGYLISNEEVAAIVEAHPDRFVGIASVNLYRPMEAVHELRHFVKDRGFRGLRIVPWFWNLPPNDRRYYPVFAECCELEVPFLTQVGHTGPLCPSEPGRPVPYLDDVALEFPDLKIIAGHVGYPWTGEILGMARKYPNVYIDTSAYKARRLPPEVADFMRGRGRKKMMFGTNYPMLMPEMCFEGFAELGLDDEAARLFLYENAEQVFGLM